MRARKKNVNSKCQYSRINYLRLMFEIIFAIESLLDIVKYRIKYFIVYPVYGFSLEERRTRSLFNMIGQHVYPVI